MREHSIVELPEMDWTTTVRGCADGLRPMHPVDMYGHARESFLDNAQWYVACDMGHGHVGVLVAGEGDRRTARLGGVCGLRVGFDGVRRTWPTMAPPPPIKEADSCRLRGRQRLTATVHIKPRAATDISDRHQQARTAEADAQPQRTSSLCRSKGAWISC